MFPAEYDIFVDVGPAKNDPNLEDQSACTEGEFRFSVRHVTNEKALELSTSTEKPFENDENVNEETRNVEL